MNNYTVVVVDDHVLLAQALSSLVNSFNSFNASYLCCNGRDLLDKLENENKLPDIILMDVKMPILNGIETTRILKEKYPEIKVLALSVENEEETIIKMLKAGAKGYILKDVEKNELYTGLLELMNTGFYHTKEVSTILINSLNGKSDKIVLKDREIEFLKWVCEELTYKEIAQKMFLSPKTIDGYRDALFEKLQTRSRTGLVMYAIRHKIVEV
ncbi:response regulator transcription factor [Aquimarina sp. ERC-38]|uniref:response regulator transcription factor n=1 Tax=Aquimarina sp. ERC-38 TaxID=2949996 RepID=UPI0022472416|nr:response regulator transcription factor [Aquimarina sp. ERC-38]UZO82322.1 response regulator transcription factor [Aquimarina sp. ERC-38]